MRVAVVNLKGGTAKTTSAMYLASALSGRGRTLLVDADPQGSALSWSEAAEVDGYQFPFALMGMPTQDVHKKLSRIAADYEHVVIDTPPGELGITRSALRAADVGLVVLSPSMMDVSRFSPTLDLLADAEDLNEELGYYVLLTRSSRITREGRDAREAMADMGLPVLAAEIPQLAFYSRAFGAAIDELADYEAATDELLSREQSAEEVV